MFGSDIRQLLLADNMAVVLSFDRFRSRNYRLLKQIRVFTSYLLARNISATVRWIPSELNNSDEPSRLFAQEESKLLTDLIPTARWPGADVSQKGTNPSTSSREDQETRAEGAPQAAGKEGKHVENDAKFREAQCQGGFGETPAAPYPAVFSLLDVDLWDPPAPKKMRSRRLPSLSSTSNTSEAGGKGAVLKKRAKRRTRKLVNMTMEDGDLTLLEKSAIGERSHKAYKAELDDFKSFARPRGLDVTDASSLDRLLTIYMNKIYLEGYQAYRGDRLAAAVLHFHPQFGKMGSEKLPRMWRALKGFRKLTPGHSRQAYPLMVWAALACELRRVGKLRMALFLLVSLSSYARPSEVIRLQTYCLVRPAHGVTSSWSLLMNPEERGERSKTGEFDNSVALDSPWLSTWAPTLFGYLKENHPVTPLWDFDYSQCSQAFKTAATTLGLDLTPYQTRHSGPSIDRAKNYRTQLEVQKGGQWKSQRSVMRFQIREVCTPCSDLGKPEFKSSSPLSLVRGKPWGDHVGIPPGARLRRRQVMHGYVMDLFAGDGGVSFQCERIGYFSKQWDI